MNLIFYGIYQLGEASLSALLEAGFEVALVITKPDDPNGKPQPVRMLAEAMGIPCLAPDRMSDPALEAGYRKTGAGAALVAGFHRKIPLNLLTIPPMGTVNVHGSLLPAYRGPTPWKHALLYGERETGATAHVMNEVMDTGDILHQERIPIFDDDTAGTLFDRTCAVAARVSVAVCRDLAAGTLRRREQDESRAFYYPNLTDPQCRIHWDWPSERIHNWVRGLNPRPGAWTMAAGHRHRVWAVARSAEPAFGAPGSLRVNGERGWLVSTGDGTLRILEITVEGGGPNLARMAPGGAFT
ncbi:MAG: methionyl-tRNA formyltransferase [Acidobacteria bacterium]|nr:methionyl-tRNA formyltransferase [Acidobacteriota bacterium]